MRRISFAALLTAMQFFIVMPTAQSVVVGSAINDGSLLDSVSLHIRQLFEPAVPNMVPVTLAASPVPAVDPLAQLPLPGEHITSRFGYRIHPIFRRRIFHEGLDFHAKYQEPVHCVLDGVVAFAGRRGGFGNTVCIFHPISHSTTYYGHLSKLKVCAGEKIKQGEIIGLAGSTGLSTGVHLHFGVKSDEGKWMNPAAFLQQVPSFEALALKSHSTLLCSTGHGSTFATP